MTYRGRIEKGKVVLDEPVDLEEGTSVLVEIVQMPKDEPTDVCYSAEKRLEHYKDVIGSVRMPPDWSENHDKYLRQQMES